MSLRSVVVDTAEGVDDLRDDWQRLLLATPTATPFHSWAWCRAFWRHLASDGSQLQLLTVRDDGGDLCGVAPMFIAPGSVLRPSVLRSLGTEVGDYGGFLVSPADCTGVSRLLWEFIDRDDPPWDSVELSKLRADATVFPDKARRWHRNDNEPCYGMELPDTLDAYLQQLPRKTRENLRRRQRRLERDHECRFWSVEKVEELEPVLADFIRLQRERFAARHYRGFFKNQRRVEFFREIAVELLQQGLLDLHCLEIDGEFAAAQFGMELHGRRFNYQIAMNPKYSRHGPGMLMMLSSIDGAIA